MTTFWEQLEQKKITTKPEIENYLIKKLGEPTNPTNQNLLFELVKKINSYYTEEHQQSHTAYSLLGQVQEIAEKRFKEGKRRGQIFYSLKLAGGDKMRALKEDLPIDKWEQIEKLVVLNQKLVLKYKNWLLNKDLVDFQPAQ